jgi:flagellar hook-associated protein 3 FlgL
VRITDNMRLASLTLDRNRSSERLMKASRVASSGLAVEAPSDGPSAYAAGAAADGATARLASRRDVMARAGGDLDLAETTLATATDAFVQAREIAVSMASGDKTPGERLAAAGIVDSLRSTVLGLANARGASGYLFGGTATATAPVSASGAFVGNDSVIGVEIADSVVVASNVSGASAFTVKGGNDVLQALADLSTALSTSNVAGIQTSIDSVTAAHAQVVSARSQAGLQADRFHSADAVTSAALLSIAKTKSSAVEADPTSSYSELARARTAFEQSIAVTSQLLSLPSLARG